MSNNNDDGNTGLSSGMMHHLGDEAGEIVPEAALDTAVDGYFFWSILFVLCISVIGILFVPYWFCFGFKHCRQYRDTVRLVLTTKALLVFKGQILFNCVPRKEKTILLDRIQDLSFSQGCFERLFGVSRLTVETAGQSGPEAGPEVSMPGVIDARAFRDKVLKQRHIVVEGAPVASDGLGARSARASVSDQAKSDEILVQTLDRVTEIRDICVDRLPQKNQQS